MTFVPHWSLALFYSIRDYKINADRTQLANLFVIKMNYGK